MFRGGKVKNLFPKNENKDDIKTRFSEKNGVYFANTERLKNSPIIYMQRLLKAM